MKIRTFDKQRKTALEARNAAFWRKSNILLLSPASDREIINSCENQDWIQFRNSILFNTKSLRTPYE